jgi:hypothetical protein
MKPEVHHKNVGGWQLNFIPDSTLEGSQSDADLDPGPACHFDADPDLSYQIKAQNLEKVLK